MNLQSNSFSNGFCLQIKKKAYNHKLITRQPSGNTQLATAQSLILSKTFVQAERIINAGKRLLRS